MTSYLNHLQVNINLKNLSFYKDLMTFLGWSVIFEDKDVIGYKSDRKGDLWFTPKTKDTANDYDGVGVNHISIGVNSIKDVDQVVKYLKNKKIDRLFDTPRHRPEFASVGKTYYQIMFESPDKILFEIVYTGPK